MTTSILMGNETCTLQKQSIQQVQSAKIKFLGRIEDHFLRDQIPNEYISTKLMVFTSTDRI